MEVTCLPSLSTQVLHLFEPTCAVLGWWSAGIGVVLGVALALVVTTLWRWWSGRQREKIHHPRQLFNELCRAHGLSGRQQRQLLKVSRQLRMGQPAQLFVNAKLLEGAIQKATFAPARTALESVQLTLFGPQETRTAARVPRR